MLDFVYVLTVLAAVMLFGALISIGNERQRKAIDGLRAQAVRWAEADLRLKRARAMRDVQVPDPRLWLEGVASHLLGVSAQIVQLTPWAENGLNAILAPCADGRSLVLTPSLPSAFVKASRARGSRRLRKAEVGILGDHPGRVPVHKMNILTCGTFFDLEAKLAWLQVTGSPLEAERLYLFEVPPAGKH
jgi:hypothetical protein